MSTQNIRCTVLTSQQGDASRPWPRYRKVSPWSDPWIAKWLVARIGDQGVGIITATKTAAAKSSIGKVRLLRPKCELPPPLDETMIDSWRIVPRKNVETDQGVTGAASQGASNMIEENTDDEAE